MKKRIRLSSAVFGLLFVSIASAQTSYVAGPVEKVTADPLQITVLGQTYLIDTQTVFSSAENKLGGLVGARSLTPGSLISIESVAPRRAALVTVSASPYVSGATTVFVGGNVEQVARDFAILKVGGLAIDVSAIPPEVLAGIEIGSLVEVSGKQPLPQGLLLADGIVVGTSTVASKVDSIGGTGTGVSVQSIGGTGKGVSTQSIGGTGTGVSVQSIGGTGKGVATQSIGGTGKGVSTQSIGGTGKSVTTASIGGTGSGASLQSIGGTGKSASLQSIGGTGSGASLQSIGGTGTAAL